MPQRSGEGGVLLLCCYDAAKKASSYSFSCSTLNLLIGLTRTGFVGPRTSYDRVPGSSTAAESWCDQAVGRIPCTPGKELNHDCPSPQVVQIRVPTSPARPA